jgi:murein hydrolase activator
MFQRQCLSMFRQNLKKGNNTPPAWILLIGLFCMGSWLPAQSRKDLEDRRRSLIHEIDQTNSRLQETRKNKEAMLGVFLTLQGQVKRRQQLINTLHQEIDFTEASIQRTDEVVESLNDDVVQLKTEYAQMVRVALRHKLNQSYLVFLFSAKSLNDAMRRWQYIRQYGRYRKKQAKLIAETLITLKEKMKQLNARKAEKENLLGSLEQQKKGLTTELDDKNKTLKALKTDERKLLNELNTQETAHNKLNSVIENVIRAEISAKKKKARTLETVTPVVTDREKTRERSSENIAPSRPVNEPLEPETGVSVAFSGQRGRLPWPLEGQVVRGFGTFQHPKFKDVKVTNNGIDIRTQGLGKVKAVCDGKVAGSQFIPGYQHIVIIQHGQYYTVYSNMQEVFVKRGEAINARQEIGRVSAEKPEIHFEVWREKQRLNPVSWLEQH